MRRVLSALAACSTLVVAAQAQVTITEVVDGDLAGGNPKFCELSNCSGSDVTFGPNDFLRVYFNGGTTASANVSLDGLTVLAGSSITIASSSGSGDVAYMSAYGDNATMYTTSSFGNGDDVYSLENGSTVLDTYGTIGVDGTGMAWEYLDSYAASNSGRAANAGAFDPANWAIGGVAALDAATDPERIALLQSLTTPKAFSCAAPAVPIAGGLGLGALAVCLLGAGTVLQRKR